MRKRARALLVLGVVLLANMPVSGELSIALKPSSASVVDGFTQSTITANFEAQLSVAVVNAPGYAGDFSGHVEFASLNWNDTPVTIWSQVEADPIADWMAAHAGSGEKVVAYTTLYVTPVETRASGYSVAIDGLEELSLETWPQSFTGAFIPMAVGTVPVAFDFGTLGSRTDSVVVPLPSAVLLGSLGLGWAGWRIRRARRADK